MNRRPSTQLPAIRATRDALPEPAGPHFLSKGRSDTSVTRAQSGGALGRPRPPQDGYDRSRVEISFRLFAAASDRPRPEVKCIAKLPGNFESYAQDYAPPDFSPREMGDFLAALEAKARENLEWVVRHALQNLKEALGAD